MKASEIHTRSALIGASLLAVTLLATGAVQVPLRVQQLPVAPCGLVQVLGIPDPRNMIVIQEGAPFVVPPGRVFVPTALGAVINGLSTQLLVDSQLVTQAVANMPTANSGTMNPLPPGLAIQAGATVDVFSGSVYGRAWGYLVDAGS